MRAILGSTLLGTLLTFVPATVWAQDPAFTGTHEAGTLTDISGYIFNPGVIGCPPSVSFGQYSGFGDPLRMTGGDGVWSTQDANLLDASGRTELSYAMADANGIVRALATADTRRSPAAR